MDQALAHASREAFHTTRERYLFCLGTPHITLFGELDPSYKGLIFPDIDLEIPDLESIIGDSIDPIVKERIIIVVKQSYDRSQMKVLALDSTIITQVYYISLTLYPIIGHHTKKITALVTAFFYHQEVF